MNRKGILIGVLAALMLFAFTACDTSSSSSYILSATATKVGDTVYIPEETVDLADYTFTIAKQNGDVSPASASDFVFPEGLLVKSATDKFTGYYKGYTEASVTLEPTIATVTELVADAENVEKTEYFAAIDDTDPEFTTDLISLAGLSLTAKYEYKDDAGKTVKGEKPVALDNPLLVKSLTSWTAGSSNVKVALGTGKAEYPVTVVANRIASIELGQTEGYAVYTDGKASGSNALKYADNVGETDEVSGIYIAGTYENGEIGYLTSDVSFKDNQGAYTLAIAAVPCTENVTLQAKYTGANVVENFERETNTITVTVTKDSVEDIAVLVSDTEEPPTITEEYPTEITIADYSDGADVFSGIKVVPVYASQEGKADTNATTLEYLVKADPEKAEAGYWMITSPDSLDFSERQVNSRTNITITATIGTETFEKTFPVQFVE